MNTPKHASGLSKAQDEVMSCFANEDLFSAYQMRKAIELAYRIAYNDGRQTILDAWQKSVDSFTKLSQ